MEGQTSPHSDPSLCTLLCSAHPDVSGGPSTQPDRTCSSRLFPSSGLTAHLTTVGAPRGTGCARSDWTRRFYARGGGGEAESRAARERCRFEAEGGAFLVLRERAWPGCESGQDGATAHARSPAAPAWPARSARPPGPLSPALRAADPRTPQTPATQGVPTSGPQDLSGRSRDFAWTAGSGTGTSTRTLDLRFPGDSLPVVPTGFLT